VEIRTRGGVFETNSSSTHAYIAETREDFYTNKLSVPLYSKEEIHNELEFILQEKYPFTGSRHSLKLSGLYFPGYQAPNPEFAKHVTGIETRTSWALRLQILMLGLWYLSAPEAQTHKFDLAPSSYKKEYPPGSIQILLEIFNQSLLDHADIKLHPQLVDIKSPYLDDGFTWWRYHQTSTGLASELATIVHDVRAMVFQSPEDRKRALFAKEGIVLEFDYA